MASANIKTLKSTFAMLGLLDKLPKGGDVAAVSNTLRAFFVKKYGEDALVGCNICNNDGPEFDEDGVLIPACPYCGVLFAPTAAETIAVHVPHAEGGPKIAKKGGAKSGEIVPLTPDQQKALNERIEKVKALRTNIAADSYDMGVELNQINDEGLWKAMGVSSFFEFCQKHLDVSRSLAYKYMLCAREYSKEIFLGLGVKKAELIASAPEEFRAPLMDAATKEGKSHTELQSALRKLKGVESGNGAAQPKGLTLNGRIKEGELVFDKLGAKSHKKISKRDIKSWYARIQLTEEVELFLTESEDGLSLQAVFKKIETAPVQPSEDATAVASAPAA